MIEKISLVNSITQDKTKTNSTNPITKNQEIFSQKEIEKSEDIYRDLGVEISEPDEPDIPPAKDPNPPKDIKSKVEKPKALIAKSLKDEFKIQDISKAKTTVVDENSGFAVTYDENGKISEIKSPDGKFIRHIDESTFTDTKINDEENYFEEITYDKICHKPLYKEKLYIDNAGKIIKRINYTGKNKVATYSTYIYNKRGKVIESRFYNKRGNLITFSKIKHKSDNNYITVYSTPLTDSEDFIIKETIYDKDGEWIDEVYYENMTDEKYCKG